MVYRAQCLFLGDVSLRFFAAMIRHARKIRCGVQGMPFVSGGSFARRRCRYTSVDMSVEQGTLELCTRCKINCLSGGRFSSEYSAGWI